MERRSFLKVAGFSSMMPKGLFAMTKEMSRTENELSLDQDLLHGRNENRSTVIGQNGMVCTSHPLASLAGIDVLKKNGNAVDAAISANVMLSLTEPMMCGPGGDLFAIVWIEKDKKLYGLNASGRSPYDWSIKKALDLGLTEIPFDSPLSWSVPGCVSGWQHLHDRFGKLKRKELFESAIHYAREGFPVTPVTAGYWADTENLYEPDKADNNRAGFLSTFFPNGYAPRYGDIFKNPDLAGTFELIAKEGADGFYKGEIAEKIVGFSKRAGGRLSLKDFQDHTANWVEPVNTGYRGYNVWELPPNGQGIAVLQMLNLLEHFDIGSLKPNSAEQLHLFIEAKKLAFEDRAVYYADMDFADVPLKQLISKSYAEKRVKLIDRKRAAQHVAPGRIHSRADTTYLTTADLEGNMVSLIQSNYYLFGSKYVVDGLGFPLQNRGALFSLDDKAMNKLEPHKRPFHTIIPAFVTRNAKPVFSFGVMGGDFQPQGQVQVLMNIIDFGMSVQQAGDQPRVSHSESSTPRGGKMTGPGTVSFEKGIPDAVKVRLSEMGHDIGEDNRSHGGYEGIWRVNEPLRYFGASESRQDGCAIGY